MADQNNTCFVISPIGDPDTDTRKRSDQILKHVFKPAAEACSYRAIRADEISKSGIITTQVIQHIIEDPMVIADLTGENPNVFYELAIRHALRKPYVQIIQKSEPIPFDVSGLRTIEVDHHDLDSVATAKDELILQMQSMQKPEATVDSPISVAIDLEVLRHGNPEQRGLADVLAGVADIRAVLSSIDKKLTTSREDAVHRFLRLAEAREMHVNSCLNHLATLLTPVQGKEITKSEIEEARSIIDLARLFPNPPRPSPEYISPEVLEGIRSIVGTEGKKKNE
jgi:hypothetical protein